MAVSQPKSIKKDALHGYRKKLARAVEDYTGQAREEWTSFQPRMLRTDERTRLEDAVDLVRLQFETYPGAFYDRARWEQALAECAASPHFRILGKPPVEATFVHHFLGETGTIFGLADPRDFEDLQRLAVTIIFAIQAEVCLRACVETFTLTHGTVGLMANFSLILRGPYETIRRFLSAYHTLVLVHEHAPDEDALYTINEHMVAEERELISKHPLARRDTFFLPMSGAALLPEDLKALLLKKP